MMERRPRFVPDTARTIGLLALSLMFGLQMVRVLFATVTWYLRDTVGLPSISLAYYAFPIFFAGFLAAPLHRAAGPRLSLWIVTGGLAILRLVEQLVFEPKLDLWISAAGTVALLLFLPISLAQVRRRQGPQGAAAWAAGLLIGLALDSAVKGLAGTLDLSWTAGPVPVLFVVAFAGLLLWIVGSQPFPAPATDTDLPARDALPLASIGPFLLLQAFFYQNQGWVAELAGLRPWVAFTVVMVGNTIAMLGLMLGLTRARLLSPGLALVGAVFMVAAAYTADRPGISSAAMVLVAQFVMGWGWAVIASAAAKPGHPGLTRTTLAFASGMLAFLILSFAYFVSLDLVLPVPRAALLPTGAVLLGIGWVLASFQIDMGRELAWLDRSPYAFAALLLLPALVVAIQHRPPTISDPEGLPVRIMTYNIHSGFSRDARQDLEAVAQVIEASGADVIGLQEVSRGWLIDGSTDLVAWFSHRLGMQILFQGTYDPVWGNALLSRYPILEHGQGDLPGEGTIIARGYLWARVDVGASEPLLVICTHLHQIESQAGPRIRQTQTILDFWDERIHTVVVGDMNSVPGSREMELFAGTGFVDSWTEAGSGPGLTFLSSEPFQRIDWIWHTPDLTAVDMEVPSSTASDHLPLVGTFELR